MKIQLERFAYSPFGTFGIWSMPEFQCFTVERPWLDNKENVSCIPEDQYTMVPARFNRGGYDTYEIAPIEGRIEIKVHIANTMNDVLGCIGLGLDLGWLRGKWAVLNSRSAFMAFMKVMDNAAHADLTITFTKQGTV